MKKSILTLMLLSTTTVYAVDNSAQNNDDANYPTRFYFGFEGGISKPLAKSFKDETTKAKVTLKQSKLYSAMIGYEFAPGMYVDLSASLQPTFKMGVHLPTNAATGKSWGNGFTKASARTYMLNISYDLMEIGYGFKPYIIFGAGIGEVRTKYVAIKHKTLFGNIDIFKTKKYTSRSFAWQAGIGLSREINKFISINAAAKLQAVHNVRLRYLSLDETASAAAAKPVYAPGKMRKTIGTGELTLGIRFSLPY